MTEDSSAAASPRKKSDRTRDAILMAAQDLFARHGYENTTVRDIAAQAAADPSLVIRYFGNKDALFARAADFDLRTVTVGPIAHADMGQRIVQHFLDIWEGSGSSHSLIVLLRSAAINETAAKRLREIFASQVMPFIAAIGREDDLPVRAGLVSTQLLGLALSRYILHLPPVVNLSRDHVVEYFSPTIQRYVLGDLRQGAT